MTAAAISAPAADVIGYRYATRAQGGQKTGHLLTRTWAEEGGRVRGRPALCGIRAQKWRAVHLFDQPGDFENCAACSVAAGLAPPPKPVRIAPAKVRPGRRVDLIAITPAAANDVNTQAARTQRRAAFRDSFVDVTAS